MATVELVRHATLLVRMAETTVLVDPMLAAAGSLDPVPNTPNQRRNPLVGLPDPEPDLEHDALLVTHLHEDHLDDAAKARLAGDVPTLCQPEDVESLREDGFSDLRTVDDARIVGDIEVTRVPARHGHGALAERMGPVSGFVLEAPDEPSIYLTGDTVWYEEVAATIDEHDPDVVVANAGAAQFVEGLPITMDAEDVVDLREHAPPDTTVVAVHMDTMNHCLVTRDDLREAVAAADVGEVVIPADGEAVDLG